MTNTGQILTKDKTNKTNEASQKVEIRNFLHLTLLSLLNFLITLILMYDQSFDLVSTLLSVGIVGMFIIALTILVDAAYVRTKMAKSYKLRCLVSAVFVVGKGLVFLGLCESYAYSIGEFLLKNFLNFFLGYRGLCAGD